LIVFTNRPGFNPGGISVDSCLGGGSGEGGIRLHRLPAGQRWVGNQRTTVNMYAKRRDSASHRLPIVGRILFWAPAGGTGGRGLVGDGPAGLAFARTIFDKICGASLRAGGYNGCMSTILVPIDFSEETPEVIECAALLARRNRSQLVLMHVSPGGREVAPGLLSNEEETAAADKLGRLERYLRDEGYQVSTTIREGEPAREIVAYGDAIKADCIIIGKHDHAPAATRAKSPITRYVEQRAPCTVVAVP
jgi:nucleotide-binding universal stress UspA family protein